MGLAYYFFHAGLYWRRFNDLPIYPLPPAMHRRAWAGFQMGYLVVALWPLFYPPITLVAGFAFMLPALSGFIIDWLIVSGRIERQADDTDQQFNSLTLFSQNVLQPALRLAIVVLLAVSLIQVGYPPVVIGGDTWPSLILLGNFGLAATMVLIGVAGRYFCLLLVGSLGWYYIGNPMQPVDYALLCCVVWSMLLGTGRFSLWQEDDHWLNRYDGA
jgi:CDP-diacylglycerol--glycerol-3-phosphate 3-phosphatidyltransferase